MKMNNFQKKYWQLAILNYAYHGKHNIDNLAINYDFVHLQENIKKMAYSGYLNYFSGRIELTKKGKIKKKELEKELHLNGFYKDFFPLFDQFVEPISQNDVYLP